MSLATNPWANPIIGGPRKFDRNQGIFAKITQTVNDVVGTGLNVWATSNAVKRENRLVDAQTRQIAERRDVARKTQVGAVPDSSFANSTGPRKIGAPNINKDNMLILVAAAVAVVVLVA